MLELDSPGIVSIVLIAVSVLIAEVLAISVGASNMPTLDANNEGKLIAASRPRQRCVCTAGKHSSDDGRVLPWLTAKFSVVRPRSPVST